MVYNLPSSQVVFCQHEHLCDSEVDQRDNPAQKQQFKNSFPAFSICIVHHFQFPARTEVNVWNWKSYLRSIVVSCCSLSSVHKMHLAKYLWQRVLMLVKMSFRIAV